MQVNSLQDAFVDSLKDIYDAEHQIIETLPQMEQQAQSKELKTAFREHLAQTRNQVQRLEQVFQQFGESPARKACKGMKGTLAEGKEMIQSAQDPDVRDAMMIAAAQHVEHYEMAAYGTLRTWAQTLGNREACGLLQQTLDEEGETDHKLTRIAEQRGLNREAAQAA
jgi:ferritin-like metal-binding protein YciE